MLIHTFLRPVDPSSPRKRRKIADSKTLKAALKWQNLLVDIADFNLHHVQMKSRLVFSFIEGPLVKALKSGEWYVTSSIISPDAYTGYCSMRSISHLKRLSKPSPLCLKDPQLPSFSPKEETSNLYLVIPIFASLPV